MRNTVRFLDGEGQPRLGTVAGRDGELRLTALSDAQASHVDPAPGLVVGHLTDLHVHLQLVDSELLADSAIGTVLDLGGEPGALAGLRAAAPNGVSVAYAGAFLTAPGGYPSDRAWAPPGSFRELAAPADAAAAVAEMHGAGATVIKVASNSTAGPVLSDELFRAVVSAAAGLGMPVVAHAEGPGEAARVRRLGATMLAHTPFSERLDEAELRAHVETVTWISTLDVHGWGAGGDEFEIARDNLTAFHRLGGTVRYGTDLGNGPLPIGVNPREVAALRAAGLTALEILATMAPADPELASTRLVFVPDAGEGATATALDIAAARPLTLADLAPTGSHSATAPREDHS